MKNKVLQKYRGTSKHASGSKSLNSRFSNGLFPCCAIGFLVSVAICIIGSLLFSWIICKTDDPARYVTPVAFSALYVASFFGGFTAARMTKRSALLCGLCVGIMIVTITFVASFAVNDALTDNYDMISAIALRVAVLICSIFGAFLGIKRKSPRKKGAKKYNMR